MQVEQSVEQEPLPHWLEELEEQASAARLDLEREKCKSQEEKDRKSEGTKK